MKIKSILIAILFFLFTPAFADCNDDKFNERNILQYAQKKAESCYSKAKYIKELERQRLDVVKASTAIEKYSAAIDLASRVKLDSNIPVIKSSIGKLISDLDNSLKNIQNGKNYVPVGGASPSDWYPRGSGDIYNSSIQKALIDEGCTAAITPDMTDQYKLCKQLFNENLFQEAAIIASIHLDVIFQLRTLHIVDELAASDLRLEQWENYFYETQFQYPWELLINFYADGGFDERFLDRSDAYKVPDSKWILMHPDVGYSYVDNGVDGNEFTPSISMQWLGYQWWSWKKDGSLKYPLGIAATSVVSDIAGKDDIGHGATLIYGKYSLSFTEHSSDVVVTLNFNLSEWLAGDNSTAKWLRNKLHK